MEGTDPQEKLKGTYWMALQKNWMLWPAVQAVNFKLVPLEHRVLVVNVVSLGESGIRNGARGVYANEWCLCIGWNCYLSYVNSQGGAKTEKEEGQLEEKLEGKAKKLEERVKKSL